MVDTLSSVFPISCCALAGRHSQVERGCRFTGYLKGLASQNIMLLWLDLLGAASLAVVCGKRVYHLARNTSAEKVPPTVVDARLHWQLEQTVSSALCLASTMDFLALRMTLQVSLFLCATYLYQAAFGGATIGETVTAVIRAGIWVSS